MATTLLELENRVRAILDEPTPAQWQQDNIRRWLNDALRDLARSTRHYKSTASAGVTAGVAEYTLAENILAIEHAYYDDNSGVMRPLVARHYEQMDQIWGAQQGREGYPAWFTTWGNSPALKLRLYPVPSTTGHVVRMNTAVLPAEMALAGSDNVNVDCPSGWVDLLVDYACYKAFLRDRTLGPDGRMLWESMLSSYRDGLNNLIHSNDYLAINREFVPDPVAGLVPMWHLDDDIGWW